MSASESANSEFRRELATAARDEEDRSKSIDNRATAMITITATATTLLVGFTGSLIAPDPENIFKPTPLLIIASAMVLTGLILAIASIFVLLNTSNPKKYFVSLSPKIFFNDKGEINNDRVDRIRYASIEQFDELLIKQYLETMKRNSDINDERMKRIFKGQLLFAADITLILAAIMLNYFATLGLF